MIRGNGVDSNGDASEERHERHGVVLESDAAVGVTRESVLVRATPQLLAVVVS
jgi:hypothetical protein